MTTQEIKSAWSERLTEHHKTFGDTGLIQVRVDPSEFKQVCDEGCPPEVEDIRTLLANRTPTHVLLWPGQLRALIDHAPRQTAHIGATIVSGRATADMDNQAQP